MDNLSRTDQIIETVYYEEFYALTVEYLWNIFCIHIMTLNWNFTHIC